MREYLSRTITEGARPPIQALLLLLSFICLPHLIPRIIIACLGAFVLMGSIPSLKKGHIYLFLLTMFCLAYVYPPYWNLFPTLPLKLCSVLLLFVIGTAWAYHASSEIKSDLRPTHLPYLALLAAIIVIINHNAIRSDVAWRGDEDYHISTVITLYNALYTWIDSSVNYLRQSGIVIPLVIIPLITGGFLYKFRRRFTAYQKAVISFFLTLMPIVLLIIPAAERIRHLYPITKDALRYPYIHRWIAGFCSMRAPYDVSLHRLVPLLSAIFLSWFLFYKFQERTRAVGQSILYSLAVLTTPLLFFYSNIQYLEMTAVLLITICIFDLRELLNSAPARLLLRPSWYCLLILSFVKETSIVFFLVILAARFILRMKNRDTYFSNFSKRVLPELKVCLLAITPICIYIVIRLAFRWHRHYGGIREISHILSVANHAVVLKAMAAQMGALLIIGVVGLVFMFRKGERPRAVLLWLVFAAITWFFMIFRPPFWLGYSRWNLLTVPVIIFASFYFIVSQETRYRAGIIALIFASNIFLVPIHLDGTRSSDWGAPQSDYMDYTYPYEIVVRHIVRMRNVRHLLVVGSYYTYNGLHFYFNKHFPKYRTLPRINELPFGTERFDKATEIALFYNFFKRFADGTIGKELQSADTIVYHSVNNVGLDFDHLFGGSFKVERKFSNREHTLFLLRKAGAD